MGTNNKLCCNDLLAPRYKLQPVMDSIYIAEGQNLKFGSVVDCKGFLCGSTHLEPYAILYEDCDTTNGAQEANVLIMGEFNIEKLVFGADATGDVLDKIVFYAKKNGIIIRPYDYAPGFTPPDVSSIEKVIPEGTSTENKLINETDLNEATAAWNAGYTPKGPASVSTLNGLSGQENGDRYVLTDGGSLSAGSVVVSAGDEVAWDATNEVWYKVNQYALEQFGTNRIKDLTNTATEADLTSGNYFALDGSAGTKKLNSTTLLTKTAQNALAGNMAPAFDPTRDEEHKYLAGEAVIYNGKEYIFKNDHYGSWSAADAVERSLFDYVKGLGRSVIELKIVDYQNITSRLSVGEFGYNVNTNAVVEKTSDSFIQRYATKSDLFFYQNHFYVYDGINLVPQKDVAAKVPFSTYEAGYITTNLSIGSVVNLTPSYSGTFGHVILDAIEGDVFYVTGSGGNASRLWAFIDSDNKLLSVSLASITRTDEKIVAPQNAAKLISNSTAGTRVVKAQMFYPDFAPMVTKRVEDVEAGLASDSAKIGDLSDATILCNIGIENGGIAYANGENASAPNRCRTISYLHGAMKVSLKSGFQIYTVIYYNKDTKAYSRSAYVQASSATITPAANEVFRLNFAKSDSSANIDSTELKNSLFIEETWAKVVDVDNRVKAIETKRQPLVLFDYDHDLKDVSSIVSQFTMSPVPGLCSQVISFFDDLVSNNSDYVSKVDVALQEGKSYPAEWGDNKMWMYKFVSDNSNIYSDNNKKKKMLIIGGLHGNEMASPVNLCIFAKNLCDAVDGNYCKLRAAFDIYIIPVINVTGSLANTRTNYNGVDLNRNFPSPVWAYGGEGTDTYSGPSAGSEFETQVVVSLTGSLQPDMAIDHHNYSGGLNRLYSELFYIEQVQLAMQCGVDNAIAFSKGLPAYFGTQYKNELFGTSNSAPKLVTGELLAHMDVWWFEQGIKFPAVVEICNTIGWNAGVPTGESLNWMGNDTFSVGEYCFRNQILHYAQWVLDNI